MAAATSSAAATVAARATSVGRALAVHIYVSEGRDAALIDRFCAAGAASGATVANRFLDAAYHRSGITLAASDDSSLEAGVRAVCRASLQALDLRTHVASHPRLGVIDHIACNPLGDATCAEAGRLAVRIGHSLGAGSIFDSPTDDVPDADVDADVALPVYLYGAARADRRPLAELRRALGYFGGARQGEWEGLSPQMAAAQRALAPDFGPEEATELHGAVVVGAVPWVHNYNLLIVPPDGLSGDELMARCRRVARAISTRGGGLEAVETMALPHERGVEVACNLLDVAVTPPQDVYDHVAALCRVDGLVLDSAYFTNKRPDEILEVVAFEEGVEGEGNSAETE